MDVMGTSLLDVLAQATAPEHDSRPIRPAMLVFAHPDDETIALGARLGRYRSGLLIHLTDGAPANGVDQLALGFESIPAYRQARHDELECMLEMAGISDIRHQCFNIPDQEASLQLAGLTRRLASCMRAFRPQVVITHPFEGGHPDHDASAFAVHHAVAMLRSHGENARAIIEAPFYHNGLQGMQTGVFLSCGPDLPEITYRLSPDEQKQKQLLFACFTTQRETLRVFQTEEERFRIAPEYEFRRVPHPGPILYDDRNWGMTSQGFIQLAWEAEDALKEEMSAPCS